MVIQCKITKGSRPWTEEEVGGGKMRRRMEEGEDGMGWDVGWDRIMEKLENVTLEGGAERRAVSVVVIIFRLKGIGGNVKGPCLVRTRSTCT